MIFEKTVLPGGVRVLTERMPEVRSVALGFWVGVGSRDEPTDLQGSSHFLEHLLFKGTERRSARDIAVAFDSVGGEANAFSAKEYACFYARVLDKDIEMAIDILSDMLIAPSIRPDDVDSERRVILEELAMLEDTPEDLVHEVFSETVFGDHPLSREVMGTVETVKVISDEDLKAFHAANYLASNVVVAAAGNLDHSEIVDLIGSHFRGKEGTRSGRSVVPAKPAGSLRVINRTTEQAHVVVGGIGYERDHDDRFAWGVLDNLLGGGMSSRLFQEIREKRGLVYSVFSYRNMYADAGAYGAYAGCTPANASTVVELIVEELDRVVKDGIDLEELDRAKGHMRGGVVLGLEEPSSRMSRLGKSELVHGEILSVDELIARVDSVTIEDVARVAEDLFQEDRRVLTVIGPFSVDDFPGWS